MLMSASYRDPLAVSREAFTMWVAGHTVSSLSSLFASGAADRNEFIDQFRAFELIRSTLKQPALFLSDCPLPVPIGVRTSMLDVFYGIPTSGPLGRAFHDWLLSGGKVSRRDADAIAVRSGAPRAAVAAMIDNLARVSASAHSALVAHEATLATVSLPVEATLAGHVARKFCLSPELAEKYAAAIALVAHRVRLGSPAQLARVGVAPLLAAAQHLIPIATNATRLHLARDAAAAAAAAAAYLSGHAAEIGAVLLPGEAGPRVVRVVADLLGDVGRRRRPLERLFSRLVSALVQAEDALGVTAWAFVAAVEGIPAATGRLASTAARGRVLPAIEVSCRGLARAAELLLVSLFSPQPDGDPSPSPP